MGNNPTHEQQKPMLETALTMGTILTEQVSGTSATAHKLTMTNTNTNINVGAKTAQITLAPSLLQEWHIFIIYVPTFSEKTSKYGHGCTIVCIRWRGRVGSRDTILVTPFATCRCHHIQLVSHNLLNRVIGKTSIAKHVYFRVLVKLANCWDTLFRLNFFNNSLLGISTNIDINQNLYQFSYETSQPTVSSSRALHVWGGESHKRNLCKGQNQRMLQKQSKEDNMWKHKTLKRQS